jgi:DNA-binding protein HU-beta
MNKTEVVSRIADYSNLSKRDAELALSGLIETVTNALAENQQVHITGFGTFKISESVSKNCFQKANVHEIKFTCKEGHAFRAGWIMKRKVDPTAVKPLAPEIGMPENNLAVLITLRSMVRANSVSDLKRIENYEAITKVIRHLPSNAYTFRQWLVAGQYLTDFRISASNKAGVVNQILFELTTAPILDLL